MPEDPYTDPDTKVLRNLLGITDAEALARAETDISLLTIARLSRLRLPGDYDLEHLRAFHRAIFDRVYPWAGEIRTVSIARTDVFCLPQYIETYAAEVFGKLRAENRLRGLDRERFVERLAHYLAEVNSIHPFREGNGRTQRAFFAQLARDAGYVLDWTGLDQASNTAASRTAMRGDEGPLRDLLTRMVR